MKSFGTPNKLKALYSPNHNNTTLSEERHKRSMNDRDRRRQIIAKLAQKRKQYQQGFGKAERESFQERVKTSIIRHKENEQLENKNNTHHQNHEYQEEQQEEYQEEYQEEHKEEEEHKSVSISTSLSISPIVMDAKHRVEIHNQSVHNTSKSCSNSPCIQSDDNMYDDETVRNEEMKMLRAQNQRLLNKLDHMNAELIETSVFLRSERKRNKNLFNELKIKEREIDELELEIEEKDKKCVECVERLSEAEQQKTILNTDLLNTINESKQWENEYYSMESKYKQEIDELKAENMNNLNLHNLDQTEIVHKKTQNDILMHNIHCIIKSLQHDIQCKDIKSVSTQLKAMLYKESEVNNQAQREINVLLQVLVGIIDKSDQQNQHNNELTLCLTKYEKDIESLKLNISEYKTELKNQEQIKQSLEDDICILNQEKTEMGQKVNENMKELKTLYGNIFTATSALQEIVWRVTNEKGFEDIDMNECIEIIADSVKKNEVNLQELKKSMNEIMMKHLSEMDAMEQFLKSVSSKWSFRIHRLQDVLAYIQIELLRNDETNTTNLSNMSMVSNINVDDMALECREQIVLINELKDELNDKQKSIECLIEKSNHIQESKYDEICRERDDALSDFQRIAEEWQNMEKHIENTYNKNESLQKEQNDLQYWINYIVNYLNDHINGVDRNPNASSFQLEFECIANDIPSPLHKLHCSLMHILTRIDLNGMDDTMCDDINDDVLLEQLFGKIEVNEESERESETDKLEIELCLESIVHKVELINVGNEAEKLIAAYQQRLKQYHVIMRELQNKIHGVSVERDDLWSQCKEMEKEMMKIAKIKEQTDSKTESMRRQLELNESTTMQMHKRLHESTEWIHEVTQQRDEIQRDLQESTEAIHQITHKYMEYRKHCETLFKHSCDAMMQWFNPLMMKLNEYASLQDRMDAIIETINNIKHKNENRNNEIEEIKKECEKSSICKVRMHADIHRFHFAKMVQQMKRNYDLHIQELQERIVALQSKFTPIEDSYSNLQKQFDEESKTKMIIESELNEIKKCLNTEMINHESIHNGHKQKEVELNEVMDNLQKEVNSKNKYVENMENEKQINVTKLKEEKKKRKKLQTEMSDYKFEIAQLKALNESLNEAMDTKDANENKLSYLTHMYNKKLSDYKSQVSQLKAVNESLNEAMHTKDMNQNQLTQIYNVKIDEYKHLNDEYEMRHNELRQCMVELKRIEQTNKNLQSKRMNSEREWMDKEDDLRNEINIIREQLHETTNDLGMMKLDILEKETVIKKLENEVNGLNETILFYEECREKDRNEKEILTQQISRGNKCNEEKVNDIKMIMDAKSVRIMKLQDDLEAKTQEKSIENNKLEIIINDLSAQLQIQKNVNVQLSLESNLNHEKEVELNFMMKKLQKDVENIENEKKIHITKLSDYKLQITQLETLNKSLYQAMHPDTNDNMNSNHNISFFDQDLEKNGQTTSCSVPNMQVSRHRPRTKHKLPIPIAKTASSKLPIRIYKNSCRSLFGGHANAELDQEEHHE